MAYKLPSDLVGASVAPDEVIPHLVEVKLTGVDSDAFLTIMETLTRIGIASQKLERTLFQTCHILHKQGKYYITHFKTLFILDGRTNSLTIADIARQNTIIRLLSEWNLIDVVNPEQIEYPANISLSSIRIVKHSEKSDWDLKPKYKIGRKIGA